MSRSRVNRREQLEQEQQRHAEAAPDRHLQASRQATAPSMQRRAEHNAEEGTRQPDTRGVRSESWRHAKRHEEEIADHARRGVDATSLPEPPSREELDGDLLVELQRLAELGDAELASVFGADAAAMEQWRHSGVPAAHVDQLRDLREAVTALASNGRDRSVSELLRAPLPNGGEYSTMLEALRAGHHDLRGLAHDALAAGFAGMELPAQPGTVAAVMTRPAITIDGSQTLQEAAQRMIAADTGMLVVLEHGEPAGVLSDRDIVVRAVAEERDTGITPVSAAVTRSLVTVDAAAPLEEALATMRQHALRRLPVTEGGRVVGVVALADAVVEQEPQSVLGEIVGAPPSD